MAVVAAAPKIESEAKISERKKTQKNLEMGSKKLLTTFLPKCIMEKPLEKSG